MIGQSAPLQQTYGAFAFWIGVLIAAAVLIICVIVALKRRMFREESEFAAPWSLQQLKDMRNSGELTDEQFEKLKSQMVAQVRGAPPRSNERPAESIENHRAQTDSDAKTTES